MNEQMIRPRTLALVTALVVTLAQVVSAGPPRGKQWEYGGALFWEVEHDEAGGGEEVGEAMEESGVWVRRHASSIDARAIATELTPGHVYTATIVAFNNPAACAFPVHPGLRCGPIDFFTNPAVQPSFMWGDGKIATRERVEFRVHRKVKVKSRIFFGSPDGLTNPFDAEVTIDLFDMGLPIPGHVQDQRTSISYGCGPGEPNGPASETPCKDLAGNGM